ncbi:MAG: hypothetical protein Q4P18_08000 [Methanobrevibacter sp.]|uniref:hypothetical protein n=1 Tax=Methanobrevibacter sp. TaxID=66852 RepID=UPI0026E07121|nr:hypothetical protein [Methanobrevibacter sp.]MDO5849463.1 hypothetical protein [Methanobrevibacter sp.]
MVETRRLENPLEDYTKFNQFNVESLLDEWKIYIKEGVDQLKNFLEGIIHEFGGLHVEYEPFWDGAYLPWFIIKIPDFDYCLRKSLRHDIYCRMEDFAKENNILPSFYMANFCLRHF